MEPVDSFAQLSFVVGHRRVDTGERQPDLGGDRPVGREADDARGEHPCTADPLQHGQVFLDQPGRLDQRMPVAVRRGSDHTVVAEPSADQAEQLLRRSVAAGLGSEHDRHVALQQLGLSGEIGVAIVVDDEPSVEVERVGAHRRERRPRLGFELIEPIDHAGFSWAAALR